MKLTRVQRSESFSLKSCSSPQQTSILANVKNVKIGRRIIVGCFRIVLADFLLHPIVQKILKHSWMTIKDDIKHPVSTLLKYPLRKILKIQLNHIFFSNKQAKKTNRNCPAQRPSKPPPFPRTLPTPFFKILAKPSADETTELAYDNRKNVDSGLIAE